MHEHIDVSHKGYEQFEYNNSGRFDYKTIIVRCTYSHFNARADLACNDALKCTEMQQRKKTDRKTMHAQCEQLQCIRSHGLF